MNATVQSDPAAEPANRGSAGTGEEFLDDLRTLANRAEAGSGNAMARRLLTAEELAPLTRLSDVRSVLALAQTSGLIALAFIGG